MPTYFSFIIFSGATFIGGFALGMWWTSAVERANHDYKRLEMTLPPSSMVATLRSDHQGTTSPKVTAKNKGSSTRHRRTRTISRMTPRVFQTLSHDGALKYLAQAGISDDLLVAIPDHIDGFFLLECAIPDKYSFSTQDKLFWVQIENKEACRQIARVLDTLISENPSDVPALDDSVSERGCSYSSTPISSRPISPTSTTTSAHTYVLSSSQQLGTRNEGSADHEDQSSAPNSTNETGNAPQQHRNDNSDDDGNDDGNDDGDDGGDDGNTNRTRHRHGSVSPSYDGGYVLTSNNFGVMSLNPTNLMCDWIQRGSETLPAPLLEIGCAFGVATVAAIERGASVIAIDPDDNHLRCVRNKVEAMGGDKSDKVSCVKGFAPEVLSTLEDSSVSHVLTSNVLHFLSPGDIVATFNALHRVMTTGCYLYVELDTPFIRGLGLLYYLYILRFGFGSLFPSYFYCPSFIFKRLMPQRLQGASQYHPLDARTLCRVAKEANFRVIDIGYHAVSPHMDHYNIALDGRESLVLIAQKL